jgi:hypothetical protein
MHSQRSTLHTECFNKNVASGDQLQPQVLPLLRRHRARTANGWQMVLPKLRSSSSSSSVRAV